MSAQRRILILLVGAAAACSPHDGTREPDLDPDVVRPPADDATDDPPPQVRLEPADPVAGEALRCHVDTLDDVRVSWTRDGVAVRVGGDVVPGDLVDGYQQWTCAVADRRGRTDAVSVRIEETCTSLRVTQPVVHRYHARLDLVQRPVTVEAWILAEPDEGEVAMTIVSRADPMITGARGTDYLLRLDGGELEWVTGGADDGCATMRAPAPPAGGWHHVAATWDPETGFKRIFVDGVRVGVCTTGSRTDVAYGDVVIGARQHERRLVEPFRGHLDEVHVSSTVRYRRAFEPSRYPSADAHTAWLLHFDDLAALGRASTPLLRDSGEGRLHLPLADGEQLSAARSTCDAPVFLPGPGGKGEDDG